MTTVREFPGFAEVFEIGDPIVRCEPISLMSGSADRCT
jgi:hypothetical protein